MPSSPQPKRFFRLAVLAVTVQGFVSLSAQAAADQQYMLPIRGLVVGGASTPAPSAPRLSLSTSSLSFGSVEVGVAAAGQTVQLSNAGNAVLTFSAAPSVLGAGFDASTNCGASLAAGASCLVSVGFTPVTGGAANGSLSVATNAAGSPAAVSLSGTGLAPSVSLASNSSAYDFGAVSLGQTGRLTFTYSNNGTGDANGVSVSLNPGTNVALENNHCGTAAVPGMVAAGSGSCTFDVVFSPSTTGPWAGATVSVSAFNTTATSRALTGTGELPPDPYISNVVGLFTFDQGLLTNSAGDLVASTIGTPAPSITASTVKYGSGSANFTGSSRIVTSIPADAQLGTNDFTIETWVRFSEVTEITYIANHGHQPGYAPWSIIKNGNSVVLYMSKDCSSWNLANGSVIGTVNVGTWYHIAVSRNGNTLRTFLNGVPGAYILPGISGVCNKSGTGVYLNLGGSGQNSALLTGQMDEFRLTNGVGRYTSAFTPTQASTH